MLIRMSIRMLINECKCKLHVIKISAPKPEERFLRLSFLVILKNTQFYNSYLNMFTSFSPITSFFFIKFLLIFSNEPYFFSHTISAQVLVLNSHQYFGFVMIYQSINIQTLHKASSQNGRQSIWITVWIYCFIERAAAVALMCIAL